MQGRVVASVDSPPDWEQGVANRVAPRWGIVVPR